MRRWLAHLALLDDDGAPSAAPLAPAWRLQLDTSLLGHEYYGSNETVIADMLDLINESKPPHLRRFLEPRRMGELFYWVFRGDPRMLGVSQPAEAPVRR